MTTTKETTYKPADAATLKARGYASDFVGAFLTLLDKSCPAMADGSLFPFEDEALRLYLTLIELGKRAEIQAEKTGILPGLERRFFCPDYIAELHYTRKAFPFHLLDGLEGAERERKEKNIRNTLGKNWKRRYARVIYGRQCRNHLGFFERERRERDEKRKATVYVDRLTDLVSEAARLIKTKRGVQVKRAALAVAEVLARFGLKPEHIFAPDWSDAAAPPKLSASAGELAAGTYRVAYSYRDEYQQLVLSDEGIVTLSDSQKIDVAAPDLPADITSVEWRIGMEADAELTFLEANDGAAFSINSLPAAPAADDDDDDDPVEVLRGKVKKCANELKKVVAALSLDDDAAVALRLELQELFETTATDTPHPDGTPRKRKPLEVRPSVLSKSDTPEKNAAWLDEIVTPPAAKTTPSASSERSLVRASMPILNSGEVPKTLGNLALAPERGFPKMECPIESARLTVEAMQSVGADKFKVVYLGSVPVGGQADCVGSQEIAPGRLLSLVGELVQRSERRGQSVTLRAWGGRLVQIDDCTREVMERLLSFAFLAVETSPENFQVWLALSSDLSDEARKDVRARLLQKFKEKKESANGGAYNSLRLPGCLNVKEKYLRSLGHYPRVALTHVELGRICSPLELEQAGLLAAPIEKLQPLAPPSTSKLPTGALPDYQGYLADAGGDRSRADIRWSMAALGAGFPSYMVVAQLETMSGKAQCRRDDYARKTVDNAASFVAASSVTKARRQRVTL